MKKRGKNWQRNARERHERGSIKTQIIRNLTAQHDRGRGTSKHADKDSGRGYTGKIYSDQTLKGYINANCQAVDWMKEQGHTPHTIVEFVSQMPDYLNHLIADGYSAWTIHTHASAAAKLYGGKTADFGVKLPSRRGDDRIHNQGGKNARAALLTREKDLLEVVRLTGLRRSELEAFRRGDHQAFVDGQTDTLHLDGHRDNTKGGRDRDVKLRHKDAEKVRELMRTSPRMQRERPFADVDKHLPVHTARHDFARLRYNRRMDEKRQRGERTQHWYICRDGSGLHFDKDVALEVSEALGHGRVDTAIINYLR